MSGSIRTIFCAAVLAASAIAATPAMAQFWQCAPFARSISGIDIRGNAGTWWAQAEDRYDRGQLPQAGAVVVLKPYADMRVGHVAMVSKIVSAREVLVTHANWSRRGQVERNVRMVDVSDAGDWSQVRVWYAGSGDLGTTVYPAYGFIYAKDAPAGADAPAPQVASTRMADVGAVIRALR
ncbi:CHAP domain-containing protein [Sphingomonas flavalba]|uniref:CHAP domain-containing protein n=1 Tax=Sphingomonas flavalba TaxID=2559804 RepID=UPI003B82D166